MISFVSKLLFGRPLSPIKGEVPNRQRRRLRTTPRVRSLEDRTLLSAGSFLQGTAFIDLHHDAILHPDDPYLSGATIALYQGTTTSGSPLATTTTNSSGAYLFNDSNVTTSYGSTGLNPGVYTLVETPPAGFVSSGTEVLSQLNPASSVAGKTNAIQVTLVNPSSLYVGFNSQAFFSRHAWDFLQEKFSGTTTRESAGQLPIDMFGSLTPTQTFGPAGVTNKSAKVTLSNTAGLAVGQFVQVTDGTTTLYSTISSITVNTSITLTDKWMGSTGSIATVGLLGTINTPFLTLCWDLQHILATGTNVFQVTPTSGQGAPPNAGEIAYLYNHYDTVDMTKAAADNAVLSQATVPPPSLPTGTIAEAVGLQVALWELEYGTNFNSLEVLKRAGNTDPAVLAQELSDVNTWAAFYKQDATGKSEVATFLEVNGAPIQGSNQGLLATGSYDFANVSPVQISTTQLPTSAPVGSLIADTAAVTGGFNPTGTVTFNLYDNPNGTGTPLFADTEPLLLGVATSASYTTKAAGTDYWVATYNGDGNNDPVTSGLADEPVTVNPVQPALVTTPSATSVTAGITPVTLTDSAVLSGGYNPQGTITFTLVAPGGATVDIEKAAVNGNGTYTTPTGYTIPIASTVSGTFQWNATFTSSNGNNLNASDLNDPQEQVQVTQAPTDLGVVKTSPWTQVWQGSSIYFTITVTNYGPRTVTAFYLVDSLPAALLNPTFVASTGSYDATTGRWSGLNLAKGQSITLTEYVQVSLSATGTVVNTVTISPPSSPSDPSYFVDTNPANNVSSWMLTVLAVSKRYFT